MWKLREVSNGWTLWRNGAHYSGPYPGALDAVAHSAYLLPVILRGLIVTPENN